ncbi:hypothetical protein [Coleofasciculus sp. FACHB-712]|nr:hypothetical protein [Coleofasciculus sp. FACHB-712]
MQLSTVFAEEVAIASYLSSKQRSLFCTNFGSSDRAKAYPPSNFSVR